MAELRRAAKIINATPCRCIRAAIGAIGDAVIVGIALAGTAACVIDGIGFTIGRRREWALITGVIHAIVIGIAL